MSNALSTKNNLYGFLLVSMVFVGLSFFFFAHIANAGFLINRPLAIGLSDGLVGYWTFDGMDVVDVTAYDRSGQGKNGTLTNNPKRVAGKIGQGMEGNGSNSYVDIGTGPTSVNTVSFWVYPKTTTEYFINLTGTTDYIWVNSGTVTATGFASPTMYVNGNESSVLSANQWQHVVVTTATSENASNLDIGRTQDVNVLEGTIDDVRVYNRALTADEIKRLYKIGATTKIGVSRKDTLTNGLVGYWTFDGQDMAGIVAYDKSGNNNDATTSPSSSPSYPPAKAVGKIGQALNFDGLGNSWASTKAINLSGTNVISASFWYKAVTPSGNNKRLLSLSPIDDDSTVGLTIQLNSSVSGCTGNVYVSLQGNVGYNQQCFSPPSYNAWHHVVIVADKGKASEEMITYVDGAPVVKLAGLNADNTNNFGTQPFYFMTKGEAQAGSTNGTIDDVRVYNRALSVDEIKRLYKIGATTKIGVLRKDTLTDGLVGYWTFDGPDMADVTAYDRSGQGNNGTLTNGPARVTGKIGQGMKFAGGSTNMGVDLSNDVFDSLTQGTIAAWIKITSDSTGSRTVFGVNKDCGGNYIIYANSSGGINTYIDEPCGGAAELRTTTSAFDNNWHHIAQTVDTSGNKLYVDGQQITPTYVAGSASTNLFFDDVSAGTTDYHIGRSSNGINEIFDGSIDDVRVYNRALTVDEIKRLYNMGR